MPLPALWTGLLSMLTNIFKWIPMVTSFLAGRLYAAKEQNDKVIDIKSRQLKKAVNPVTDGNLDDRLRDDDNW